MQVMVRDTGPFVHSESSRLFGASVWIPVSSSTVRVTAEYADTIFTQNFFSFGKDFFGTTYMDYKYTDGWQYRDQTLGSSLGTDSRLATLQAAWTGAQGIGYSIGHDRAAIGSPKAPTANIVSQAPVTIDIGEWRSRFLSKLSMWGWLYASRTISHGLTEGAKQRSK